MHLSNLWTCIQLYELAGIELPSHLEGQSFVPLLDNSERAWKKAVFSQYPNPALREWAANPLTQGMRETYFGPLIEEVETRIIDQQEETIRPLLNNCHHHYHDYSYYY